jgi:hypothetical protein
MNDTNYDMPFTLQTYTALPKVIRKSPHKLFGSGAVALLALNV